jgi:nucleotide-binding universal stress UspA family protein
MRPGPEPIKGYSIAVSHFTDWPFCFTVTAGARSWEHHMMNFDGGVQPSDPQTMTQPVFRRVLVCVEDASHVESAVELAQRASVPGLTEARVLHLYLRETIRGQRFALETEAEASYVMDAAVFELRMAGLGASGQIRKAPFDKAAESIITDATEWGADLIVLGCPRRGELRTRLFGSVTLRVQQHAPCPVLLASTAGRGRGHRVEEQRFAGHRS